MGIAGIFMTEVIKIEKMVRQVEKTVARIGIFMLSLIGSESDTPSSTPEEKIEIVFFKVRVSLRSTRALRNARREIKAPKKALAGGIGLEWLISSPFKH